MTVVAGSRWKSAVCDAEIMVVKPPADAVELQCGGAPMVPAAAKKPDGPAIVPNLSGGTTPGKRYGDDALGLEVLCVKAGAGTLAVEGRALALREAKRLPSSD